MKQLVKDSKVYIDGKFEKLDVLIENGVVSAISDFIDDCAVDKTFYFKDCYIFPGFTDVHVHFREPGFSYKETIKTGSMAAAHGGYTNVCTMPNLNPVPDSLENLMVEQNIIDKDAVINVLPFGSLTIGEMGNELSEIEKMSPYCIGFSDDGRGVQNDEMMLEAMNLCKANNKIISAHCEVNELLKGGYIHDGDYAKKHNHKGICSESEWKMIERDIALAKETGCAYHVCHISTKESVDLIRNAKKNGVNISCETGPHYLILSDKDIQENGNFKMNPPLRDESDRKALIEGICDGTIDMIATDHAPHSKEEKSKGLKDSNMGIVGIETAFSLLYTHLVKTNIITLNKLVELMSINPNKRFNIEGNIKIGSKANLTIFDLNDEYTINCNDFISKGKSTPFENYRVYGKCKMTMYNGNVVYEEDI